MDPHKRERYSVANLQGSALRQRGIRQHVLALLLVCSSFWLLIHLYNFSPFRFILTKPHVDGTSPQSNEFRWSQIQPTPYLDYVPCFEKFQCARLEVPMDWNATGADTPRVTIAIVRLPAPVSVVDPRYGGIILTNPGGPGGSGVFQALSSAEHFATIINPTSGDAKLREGKYFDIVSFDPRGINNTTPRLKCFPDTASFDIWRYQEESDSSIDHGSISNLWSRSKASTAGCSEGGGIIQHMNTPAVVADMVEIIERHGEWRSKQASSWLASNEKLGAGQLHEEDPYSPQSVHKRTEWHKGEEQLHYWGFSYGSLLGSTFAAMQPHRAHRLILDGVEESTDYYSTAWALNLKDTDKIMEKFYTYCSLAGPENCALNSGESSSSEIRQSVETIISSIKDDPLAVPGTATRSPEIITYSDVMRMIKSALYRPLAKFPEVAELLADLRGNGSNFAVFKQASHKPSCPLEGCKDKEPAEPCYPDGAAGLAAGIMCSDGAELKDRSKEGFREYAATLYNQSRWLGELWAPLLVKCYHWKGKASWRIKADEIKGNTTHPILWIGNTLDPVTPLSNAHIMSARFPGSVVLEQESEGHCSLSSPSICTARYIRDYFQTGELPKAGTICQPDVRPLVGKVRSKLNHETTEDAALSHALGRLSEIDRAYGFL